MDIKRHRLTTSFSHLHYIEVRISSLDIWYLASQKTEKGNITMEQPVAQSKLPTECFPLPFSGTSNKNGQPRVDEDANAVEQRQQRFMCNLHKQ